MVDSLEAAVRAWKGLTQFSCTDEIETAWAETADFEAYGLDRITWLEANQAQREIADVIASVVEAIGGYYDAADSLFI
ncbi:hypothetical protein, partial [Escherichia coli]|uniref:hypothetical protein n=1 Tax=Escherichia coli TaxID=562 RepID=UPI0013D39DB7